MTGTAPTAKLLTIRCQFCQTCNRVDAERAANKPKCGKCARPMLLDRPLPLDDETFDRTIESSDIPVLVDFHADLCGPCKAMAPSVDQLAKKMEGRALIAKLDTDRAKQTAARFRISAIPTVMVFRGGKEARRNAGAVPLAGLERMLAGMGEE